MTLWTAARQAPLSTGFPRQERWSGLPFPPPGDLPDPGIEPASPASPALAGGFFTTEPPREAHGKPHRLLWNTLNKMDLLVNRLDIFEGSYYPSLDTIIKACFPFCFIFLVRLEYH